VLSHLGQVDQTGHNLGLSEYSIHPRDVSSHNDDDDADDDCTGVSDVMSINISSMVGQPQVHSTQNDPTRQYN